MSGYSSYGNNSYGDGGYDHDHTQASSQQPKMSKEQFEQALDQQLAMGQFQVYMKLMTKNCFNSCVPKPTSSLGSSEKTCIGRCADRFREAVSVVQAAVLESNLSK